MIPEILAKHFDLLADAPNGVPKLRALILQLAVQGQLVPQNPREEPVALLLEQIKKDILELVSKRNRSQNDFLPLQPVENKEQIPQGWACVPFGAVVRIIRGITFPSSAKGRIIEPDTVACLRTANIQDQVDWDDLIHIPKHYVKRDDQWILPCDILISMANSYELVGKVCQVQGAYPTTTFGGFIASIRPFRINPRYVLYYLRSPNMQAAFRSSSSQTTNIANISLSGIRPLPILLPPLAEQHRIVAKVDELMALCDELEERQRERKETRVRLCTASHAALAAAPDPRQFARRWQRICDHFHLLYDTPHTIPALRQTVLTLAVRGRLVPQDPKDEQVDDLLARSLTERQKLNRTAATEVQPIAGQDALGYNIPVSWRWQRLDDLLIFGPTNGFSPKAVDYETPVRSLTLSATTSGRFKGEHSKFITTDVPPDSDLWLRDGDILVQRGNTIEYVGVPAVYRGEPNRFVYPDLMMKLRVSSTFDAGYIHLAMSQEAARDFLRARASGTSGSMPKINQTTLKSLPLPIPPFAEQRRIVAKVDQLMSLCDELEKQLTQSEAESEKLMEAFVHHLLNGKTPASANAA